MRYHRCMSSTINMPVGLQVQCTRRAPDFNKSWIIPRYILMKISSIKFQRRSVHWTPAWYMRTDRYEQVNSRFFAVERERAQHWILPPPCYRVLHVILTLTRCHTPTEDPVAGLQMVTPSVYCEVRTEHFNTIWKNVMQQHLTSGRKHENVATLHLGRGPRVQFPLPTIFCTECFSESHPNI